MAEVTGYGPSSSSSRWNRLYFDGDADKYEQWEIKFLGYMKIKKLKQVITGTDEAEIDADQNEEVFAELIQLIDDRSLQLVMREAVDDGRKAMKILREHYAGKGKPRVIALYQELTSMHKTADQTATDYILQAERVTSALLNVGETVSDSLVIAMLLKGLPDEWKPFVAVVTQSEETHKDFAKFKVAFKNFAETERSRGGSTDGGSVMKANESGGKFRGTGDNNRHNRSNNNYNNNNSECYACGRQGHKSTQCRLRQDGKLWCTKCKKNTHSDKACKKKSSSANKAKSNCSDSGDADCEHSFQFYTVNNGPDNIIIEDVRVNDVVEKEEVKSFRSRMLVDSGATSHIVNSSDEFVKFDKKFNPEKHSLELADGRKVQGLVCEKGAVSVNLTKSDGEKCNTTLNNTLFIPSFPQEIFSISSATKNGAMVTFKENSGEVTLKDGTSFNISRKGDLYYLDTCNAVETSCRKESLKM